MKKRLIKKIWGNLKALLFGLLIAFVILEIFLRIANPFNFRVRGENIILPANMAYTVNNPGHPQLDEKIRHTKNGIGFRGPEKPENYADIPTVIAVGGSTTECFYLSDGHDWPAQVHKQLNATLDTAWVNNAGLDGHSTFGHKILLEDYVLDMQPDMILFLTGVNDVGTKGLRPYDSTLYGWSSGIRRWLENNSAVFSTIVNLRRAAKAKDMGLQHEFTDLRDLPTRDVHPDSADAHFAQHAETREAYRERVRELVDMCLDRDIRPVLLTQPMLWGDTIDPVTGADLGRIDLGQGENGALKWRILESYNEMTRAVAAGKNVPLIDLAVLLPKSSAYFYDSYHYTNEGAQKVGALVTARILPLLKSGR